MQEQDFICPITSQRFKEPVNTLSGQTYELQAISQWISTNIQNRKFKDPVSGQIIPPTLIPNHTLRKIIEDKYPGTTTSTRTTSFDPTKNITNTSSLTTSTTNNSAQRGLQLDSHGYRIDLHRVRISQISLHTLRSMVEQRGLPYKRTTNANIQLLENYRKQYYR